MSSEQFFGPVLVTGGCGFIGYHIVLRLLEHEPTAQISVLDQLVKEYQLPSVTYYDCDISSKPEVQLVLDKIRPRIVFHAACTYSINLKPAIYEKINTIGTRNVLECAQKVGTVQAFIYHSSSSVQHDNVSDQVNVDETWPVIRWPAQKSYYSLSKVAAEEMVLAANRQHGMLTASVRPCGTFGEADFETLGVILTGVSRARARIQIGHGNHLFDFLYVGNLAHAHMLVARALLRASSLPFPPPASDRVDGEAFIITNDEPWLFWDLQRAVLAAAGFPVRKEEIRVVPMWLALVVAFFSEWMVWIVSLGTRPSRISRKGVRFTCMTRTFSCEKAKRVLGYRPIFTVQEGIDRSVAWFRDTKKLQ